MFFVKIFLFIVYSKIINKFNFFASEMVFIAWFNILTQKKIFSKWIMQYYATINFLNHTEW